MKKTTTLILAAAALLAGCKRTTETVTKTPEPITQVSTSKPVKGSIGSTVEVMATTQYQRHWTVTAPYSAYITGTYAETGQAVNAGQRLFTIETKEHRALDGAIPQMQDIGCMTVKAPRDGVVTDVSQQQGCYVQEGTVLVSMADPASMVFCLDVPYEDMCYVRHGGLCKIKLPDGSFLTATLDRQLTETGKNTQSVRFTARTKAPFLPEGMNVLAIIEKPAGKKSNWLLPEEAIQSSDDMSTFWIMKLLPSGRAKRIDITIGNSSGGMTEVISPTLSSADAIITAGSYGLNDGALCSTK